MKLRTTSSMVWRPGCSFGAVTDLREADMLEKVFRWLNAAKTLASHNAAREQYLHGTGLWFKTSFENWKEGRQRYLWLEGSRKIPSPYYIMQCI